MRRKHDHHVQFCQERETSKRCGHQPRSSRFYRVKRYLPLAPPRWLLKAKDPELFDREYRKQLESLDAKQVAEDLAPDAILLCWESFNVRCHRRLVAEWLEEKLGIVRA